ncbi:hypothetical protein [Paraglaciecola aestuariivivens]
MRKLLLTLVFASLWSICLPAKTFVVATQNFQYYPHYHFDSETDKGFIWAVLEKFSEVSGHQFDYYQMPVLRLQKELEKGSLDLVYPDNPLFNNKQTYAQGKYYSHTIVTTLGGAWVDKAKLGQGVKQVKRLSIPLGYTPQVGWNEIIAAEQVSLFSVIKPLAALQLLALHRVDGAEIDYFVGRNLVKQHPEFSDFSFDPSLPHSQVEFKLSTITQRALIDEINQFIHTEQHLINQLKRQYGFIEPAQILQQLPPQSPNSP